MVGLGEAEKCKIGWARRSEGRLAYTCRARKRTFICPHLAPLDAMGEF